MNGYTITSIDNTTGAIYATFTLDEYVLNETVFVGDINDVDLIKKTLQDAYIRFQENIITNSISAPQVPLEVESLIGKAIDATTFSS